MQPEPLNSVAILGPGPSSASFALRKVLKFKEVTGPLFVLDYTGRGAAALCDENASNLHKRPVLWIDLADRQKPVALFSLRRSEHFRKVMLSLLWSLRAVSGAAVADETLVWAAEAAWQLSKDGAVGLLALLKSLASNVTRRWFLDTQSDPSDLGRLLKILSWALRFPSVYALSEANNRVALREMLKVPQTTWIEMHSEYFEPAEYQLAASLVDCAVEDAVRTWGGNGRSEHPRDTPTILHLFPAAARPDGFSAWVGETSDIVRQVAVFRLEPGRPPCRNALAWAKGAQQTWIVGGVKELDAKTHGGWLSEEEFKVVEELHSGSLFLRSNGNGNGNGNGHPAAIVAKIGRAEIELPRAHLLRYQSAKPRRVTPVRQLSTAVGGVVGALRENDGLYQRLCNREMLRWGWFKVSTHNKLSHGVDNVTVEMFKENLEAELDKLSDELTSRTYRCRPLRRVYIPKADGGQRPLGIGCVRDRVVQSACLMLIEPLFEPSFSHFSFAFRPRRNAHQALALARSFIASGRTWAVIADIRKCFDNLDHDVLMGLVSRKIGDQAILDLITHWLTVDVLDFCDLIPTDVGVPQGESLSPLFANIYLDPFDKHFERFGYSFVRYADDITIMATSEEEAKKALGQMADFMHDPLHLELKPAKTNYVAIKDGFDFLGFRLSLDGVEIQTPKMDRVTELLRDQLKALGDNNSTLDQRASALIRTNAVIRGFRNYFRLPNEPKIGEQLTYLDGRVEQMAHYYLPVKIRDDPAWVCRERFSLPGDEETDSAEKAKEQLSAAVGGYPSESSRKPPEGWMTKGNGKADPVAMGGKTALHVEDAGEEGSEEKSGKYGKTVVEHGERLYVLTHGSYLLLDGDDLVIRKRQTQVYRRPLGELGLLFLQGIAMNISVSLQLKLAELDIPVVFAPPVGEPMAVLNPVKTEKSFLRGQQVLRRDDPDIVAAGLDMLSAKVGNQAAVLRYFAKYRIKTDPDFGRMLLETAQELKDVAGKIRALDTAQAEIRAMAMGYEGHAAALYWKSLVRLAPDTLEFEGRITRNASDIVNQCINYVYGMLYGEVWRALTKHGLDPYFGFVHGSKRNQGSLVFDLIEEFRAPFADRFVFGMLGRGFKPEIGEHGHLRTESKRQLAKGFSKRWTEPIAWRSHEVTPGQILEYQAACLVKLIKREGRYLPFRMRW